MRNYAQPRQNDAADLKANPQWQEPRLDAHFLWRRGSVLQLVRQRLLVWIATSCKEVGANKLQERKGNWPNSENLMLMTWRHQLNFRSFLECLGADGPNRKHHRTICLHIQKHLCVEPTTSWNWGHIEVIIVTSSSVERSSKPFPQLIQNIRRQRRSHSIPPAVGSNSSSHTNEFPNRLAYSKRRWTTTQPAIHPQL